MTMAQQNNGISKPAIGEAREVPIPAGRPFFVPIGSQEDEETEKTPRVPVERPGGSKGSE